MTKSERDAARRLCDEATPGPWAKLTTANVNGIGFTACARESFKPSEGLANGKFVLAARMDLPAALDHIDAAHALLSDAALIVASTGMSADLHRKIVEMLEA